MAQTKPKTKKSPKKAAPKYVEGIGRRKTATARVRIFKSTKANDITINDRPFKEYFPQIAHQNTILSVLKVVDKEKGLGISVKVSGSGISAQAGAVRHGLARALIKQEPELRQRIKPFGYLTRDPRMVECKKYGLKKARRAPQWSKR